jgi:DnaJ-domain-containing protein 1
MDYFALLQQPRQPWLDNDALKKTFLQLAAQFHPDKIHQASDAEKIAANQRYVELNAAYHCLLEPKDRLLHLIELQTGAKPKDVQAVPPGAMDLLMEIGQVCRETDLFLTARDKTTSPLVKAQMFEKGMAWTDKLTALKQRVDARREEVLAELKTMNGALSLEKLEQAYRVLGYAARWSGQIQERLVKLSF